MNKQTKTILMVGGGAVVAYLIYKAMTKPTTSTESNTASFINASGRLMGRPEAKCAKSPLNYETIQSPTWGTLYECCGFGKYALQAGPVVECKNAGTSGPKPKGASTTITPASSERRVFSSRVSSNPFVKSK